MNPTVNPTLTREFLLDALTPAPLDPRCRALYDLCFFSRQHLSDEIVVDKLRMLARLHAESSAALSFSPEYSAHCLIKSPVDRWFGAISTSERLDASLLLESHKRVMDVFADLPEDEARALASRYLHFHFPELFHIHDGRVDAAARDLLAGAQGYLAMGEHDPVYGGFHARCRKLAESLRPLLGRRPNPRELDRILRAWAALGDADVVMRHNHVTPTRPRSAEPLPS
jgi:hypothetical protein